MEMEEKNQSTKDSSICRPIHHLCTYICKDVHSARYIHTISNKKSKT